MSTKRSVQPDGPPCKVETRKSDTLSTTFPSLHWWDIVEGYGGIGATVRTLLRIVVDVLPVPEIHMARSNTVVGGYSDTLGEGQKCHYN